MLIQTNIKVQNCECNNCLRNQAIDASELSYDGRRGIFLAHTPTYLTLLLIIIVAVFTRHSRTLLDCIRIKIKMNQFTGLN